MKAEFWGMYLLESTWPRSHHMKHMKHVKFMSMSKVRRLNFEQWCSCSRNTEYTSMGP